MFYFLGVVNVKQKNGPQEIVGEMVVFLATRIHGLHVEKCGLLIFLADHFHFVRYGRSITCEPYYLWRLGNKYFPSSPTMFSILNSIPFDHQNNLNDFSESGFEIDAIGKIFTMRPANPYVFSESDIEAMTQIIKDYGKENKDLFKQIDKIESVKTCIR